MLDLDTADPDLPSAFLDGEAILFFLGMETYSWLIRRKEDEDEENNQQNHARAFHPSVVRMNRNESL